MDPLWHFIRETGQALVGLLSTPYLYIAILLVLWHERRAVALQRKMFHVRLYGTLAMVLRRTGAGVLVGVALSAASLAVGANLSAETLLIVWVAMLLLALLRLRYLCLAYAAGALGVLQFVLNAWMPEADQSGVLRPVLEAISDIDVPGLLVLAGLLHIAEGLLVRLQGAGKAIPLFLEGKRGKPIGAYAMGGLWPVPLLWLVPATGTDGIALPWVPLFGSAAGEAVSWTLLAFPVLISFGDRTISFWPERKARTSGYILMIYGILLVSLAIGAFYLEVLAIVASVAVFVLREALALFNRAREAGRSPLYAHDGSGVRILAVLPGTPAAELGLVAGETIRKVNGMSTLTKEDLHAALQRQSAFCKLEVVNREGHVKFLQRARFADEHYQLGLILVPDDEAQIVAAPDPDSLWMQLRHAGARRRNGEAMPAAEAAETLTDETEEATAASGDSASANAEGDVPLPDSRDADADVRARQVVSDAPQSAEAGLPPRRSKR